MTISNLSETRLNEDGIWQTFQTIQYMTEIDILINIY